MTLSVCSHSFIINDQRQLNRLLNPQRDATKRPAVLQGRSDAAFCHSLSVPTASNEIQMRGLARPVDSKPAVRQQQVLFK